MASRPSCSLCGATFRAQVPTADMNEPAPWYSKARGIRGDKSSSDLAHPALTGPGWISGGRLIANFDADSEDFVENNNLDHRHELTLNDEAQTVMYGMHDFCWRLLRARVGARKEESRAVAACLFHVLAALPYSRTGGLIARDGYSGTAFDTAEILQADPEDISFDAINDTPLPESIATPLSLFQSSRPVASDDPFGRLPVEIMHSICDELPSWGLCYARLASRCFAECASPAALPQRFWAGRFAYDKELGFMGVNTAALRTDYYQLYRKCRLQMQSTARPGGLANRRRIARCVLNFAMTIQALMCTRRSDWDSPSPRPLLPEARRVGDGVSCPELSPASAGPGSLVFGAKTHRTQVLSFERHATSTDPLLLQYSLIFFDGRVYLSGLRVSADGQTHHVGYMVPGTTMSVSIEPQHKIRVIDVYISIAGIHGMVLWAGDDNLRARHVVGLGSPPPDDLDVAVTRIHAQGTVAALFLGLDMFKLVSLHVIDTMVTSERRLPSPPVLWKSRLPREESHRPLHAELSRDPLSLSFFLMHLRIPFGGEDGSRLSSLTRIAGLLDGAIGLHGLIFAYHDREEVLYGARVSPRCAGPERICVEQSFLIDGPGGERIVEITYSSRTGSDALRIGYPGISAMEVVTNFQRRYTFCAFDNYGNIRVQMHRRTVRTSPAGHCPTVLTVGLGAPAWFLETAETSGFVPLPETDLLEIQADTPQTAPSEQALACSPWMLSVGGSCFTSAPLADVQRVRVSVGAKGRCRDKPYISGLRLEYRGQTRDAIVGQWMTDGGHFVLEPHERFVDISVLTTRETELRGTGGAVGKVNCLIFTTSLGRVFNIHFGEEVGTETILRYQATPYEDLATITWAFNSSVDDIQFNLTPSPALGRGNFLLLTDANQRIRHPWLLQDETRLFYKYGDAMPRSPAVRDVGAMRRDAAARRYTGTCEMFFWEEKDRVDSGKTLRLQRIEVMHKKGVVDGFLFEYEGGLARSFGWQNIEKSVVDLTTHKDERLSTLVVFHHTEHRSGLEIHTTKGQVCRVFPETESIMLAAAYAMVPGAKALTLTTPNGTHQPTIQYPIPERNPSGDSVSECVGMWVSGYTAGSSPIPYVDSFGPIYRTGSVVQSEQEDGRPGLRQSLRGLLLKEN